MLKSVRAIVSGEVQGVGFRYFVLRAAAGFKVAGFVRNLQDGTVEIGAEGEREELERFLDAVKLDDGFIRVAAIASEWGESEGKFKSFGLRR
ncbi:MAG: acylphosphatase [Candidatus Micrarchaeota archaeon]